MSKRKDQAVVLLESDRKEVLTSCQGGRKSPCLGLYDGNCHFLDIVIAEAAVQRKRWNTCRVGGEG